MTNKHSILWFRQDLRLDDNPAMQAAIAAGGGVIPVYIWNPKSERHWPPGAASRVWLHGALENLQAALAAAGSRLIIREGESLTALRKLIDETSADAVYWNRRYEPANIAQDKAIESVLGKQGVTVGCYNSQLLIEPGELLTHSGTPYKVFTPFYRAGVSRLEPDAPPAAPTRLPHPAKWPASAKLDDLKLLPRIPWNTEIDKTWKHAETTAVAHVNRFISAALADYLPNRDRPDLPGTSRLSPYLHFGEISPRRLWHAVRAATRKHPDKKFRDNADGFIRQLWWREFAYHLLFHFPETPATPLKESYASFPWRDNAKWLRAWQKGETGYPIIDAGMRQLWHIGWMHNRVRLLVGSFLVKDLLIPWQRGAEWFWDTLVDADLANNTLGWQWVAGCGADASPFFRIFNPITQGQKFDPTGDYIRQWVPELSALPKRWIHEPWNAPAAVLQEAGVKLGQTYPKPMVDHDAARIKALEAFTKWRGK